MALQPYTYIPGSAPRNLPLSRFLPLLPEGMASAWLHEHAQVPAGSWVLDPLGASPSLVIEAARAGYRVVVTTTNPILSFMIEVMASAPQTKDLQAALSSLAILRRGDVRLESELKALYVTRCRKCGAIVQADGYLWERDAEEPYACLYHCPSCGDEGEHPPDEFDLGILHSLGSHKLHYARALERVNVGEKQAREGAEDALKTILPRQLYVISTLINKAATLKISAVENKWLHALIISVCDQGNALYAWPSARSRPRQLNTPPRFRENNLWTALESGIQEWQCDGPAVELSHWPELPAAESGICIFSGRPAAFVTNAKDLSFKAMISTMPRPSQAFWTLSALWTGWLWGNEAVLPMKSALERRRYDWNWYAEAIFRLFRQLRCMPTGIPFLQILPELVPGFLEAAMLSSGKAGLQLQGFSLNDEENIAQLVWQTVKKLPIEIDSSMKSVLQNSMLAHLQERGEPARQMQLEIAGLAELPFQNYEDAPSASELLSKTQNNIQGLLNNREIFFHNEDPDLPLTRRSWWPVDGFNTEIQPYTDRVEHHILESLITTPAIKEDELYKDLYTVFPGLLTPPNRMVDTILASYAHTVSDSPAVWQINDQERPQTRQSDVQRMQQELLKLGKELKYYVEVSERSIWWIDRHQRKFVYHCFASSMFWNYVQTPLPISCHGVLVFPGSRSRLLAYKLEHNPLLAQATNENWTLLKFRHLRNFLRKGTASRARWMEHLEMDPPLWEEAKQMRFFT
jgi:hypothetical protein